MPPAVVTSTSTIRCCTRYLRCARHEERQLSEAGASISVHAVMPQETQWPPYMQLQLRIVHGRSTAGWRSWWWRLRRVMTAVTCQPVPAYAPYLLSHPRRDEVGRVAEEHHGAAVRSEGRVGVLRVRVRANWFIAEPPEDLQADYEGISDPSQRTGSAGSLVCGRLRRQRRMHLHMLVSNSSVFTVRSRGRVSIRLL